MVMKCLTKNVQKEGIAKETDIEREYPVMSAPWFSISPDLT
jgi:hypothetical protein